MRKYFVLSNEIGTILAVYGSALHNTARERGQELKSQCGARVALHDVTGNKPSVYGTISMKGAIEWL